MNPEPQIDLLFRCRACNLDSCKIRVRARYANEDVLAWLHAVVAEAASVKHWILSPLCRADKFDLAIPLIANSNMGVGQVPIKENTTT